MILVSAGHYPAAKGAQFQGFTEYPETAAWADALVVAINGVGENKTDYPLAMRIKDGHLRDKVKEVNEICKATKVFCAIEIHFNSANVPGVKGSETLYAPGSQRGRKIARIVQRHLAKQYPPNRGIKEGWYRMDRPGVIDYAGDVEGDEIIDYFLRKTMCPALIIEPEFVQNYDLIVQTKAEGILALAEGLIDAYFAPATR
jgi:hypothetical protein